MVIDYFIHLNGEAFLSMRSERCIVENPLRGLYYGSPVQQIVGMFSFNRRVKKESWLLHYPRAFVVMTTSSCVAHQAVGNREL